MQWRCSDFWLMLTKQQSVSGLKCETVFLRSIYIYKNGTSSEKLRQGSFSSDLQNNQIVFVYSQKSKTLL